MIKKSHITFPLFFAAALLPSLPAGAATLTTLYQFLSTPDGSGPTGGLAVDGGALYGMTTFGGVNEVGSVFTVDPANQTEAIVYSLGGKHDGMSPWGTAGVTIHKGILYGATSGGGVFNAGTVFAMNLATGAEVVLHSFSGGSDGGSPNGRLRFLGGKLYGITTSGGASGNGTAFVIDVTTGVETVLHSFQGGADGSFPAASITVAHGTLYGTTLYGGANDAGTIFAIDLRTGTESVLYSFSGGIDGRYPYSNLIFKNGILYGTTEIGGKLGSGNIFSFDIATGQQSVLYSFGGADGALPVGDIAVRFGTLYGTTMWGGSSGDGTVFQFNIATGTESVLHAFSGTDGETPEGGLIYSNGSWFGTTYEGGNGNGTVFVLTP